MPFSQHLMNVLWSFVCGLRGVLFGVLIGCLHGGRIRICLAGHTKFKVGPLRDQLRVLIFFAGIGNGTQYIQVIS